MRRRALLAAGSALTTLSWAAPRSYATANTGAQQSDDPILVVVELSGGNDGLNSVVPYADDAYYRHRPRIGIKKSDLLLLDDHHGLNPGMLGFAKLWRENQLAIIHGCGYPQPSYSHFTSMAYWHTGMPHRGSEYGWMGRLADVMAPTRQSDMLVHIGSTASLAVKSAQHTPVVFDDPERFQRDAWLSGDAELSQRTLESDANNPNSQRAFLNEVNASAQSSSRRIRQAWRDFSSPVDYGIAPMDLPKVAACIDAGLPTSLYHVAFRNNAFDTHVQQPALHRRLLSYACDGVYGFLRDLQRMGHADRVVVLVYSEFGRRVPENANFGTDHGTANVMFLAGKPVIGGHHGTPPSLTTLTGGDNLAHTVDFRRVYATVIQNWMGVPANAVLADEFEPLNIIKTA